MLEREPLEGLAARRPAARVPPHGLLGVHGHLQGRGGAERPVGRRARRRGAVSARTRPRHRRLRPAGPVAGPRAARARRPGGRRCAATCEPVSGLALEGLERAVTVVSGDVLERRPRSLRALADYEVGHRLPPRRPDAGRDRARRSGADLRGQRARHVDGARGVPRARGPAHGRGLLGQGLRRRASGCPTARTIRCAPRFPYDASKAAADVIARSYWPTYGLPVAVTRFANLYGGGDLNRSRLVPEAVGAALAGRAPVIRSDGTPERDWLYAQDAAAAYLAIADALDGPARRAARPSTPAAAARTPCARWSSWCAAPPARDVRARRARHRHAGRRDRPPVRRHRPRSASAWAGRPRVELEEGLRAHGGVVPGPPAGAGGLTASPAPRLAGHVRSLQVGVDQAQEGGRRRAPRPALHQARARDHRRRARGRWRPRFQRRRWPTPSRRRATPRCPRTTSSARSPRAPARARDADAIETVVYEGYGPGGVAILDRGAHRQPQPHRRRDAPRVHQARRQPRRARLGRLPVRQARRDRRRRRRATPRTT